MDKDAAKCDICRKPVVWPSHYGDWECPHCHQRYEYDEGLKIKPTDAQWALLRNPPRWIAVQEQWPKHGSDVLVAYKAGKYVLLGVGEFDGTTVNDDGVTVPYFKGIGGFEVTHWMPLPEPPALCR
jgi:hypothetical protein